MNQILVLISLGKIPEASRHEKSLNKLIEDGDVWELNNLLTSIKKEIDRYKD